MANVREIGVFLRKDVTWDTVTPFSLCSAIISTFARFIRSFSRQIMVGEFLYPLYVYHFMYP